MHLEGCAFIKNSAYRGSGAIVLVGERIELVNCTFVNNVVTITEEVPELTGIISWWEKTDPNTERTNRLALSNCILWDNSSPVNSLILQKPEDKRVEIQNCCIQGLSYIPGDQGNFGDDPLFANLAGPDQIPGTADDDVSLSPNSPCIDRGDNALIGRDRLDVDRDQDFNERLPFDINGEPRIWGGSVDVGASESRSADPTVF